MKRALWFGLGTLATVVLVAGLLLIGWRWWGRGMWARPRRGPIPACEAVPVPVCRGDLGAGAIVEGGITLEQARSGFQDYIDALTGDELELAEVMEFEHNFYAIVVDEKTGVGAAELLADKVLGRVTPEMGPNMMWGTSGMHGMRRGMMGGPVASAELRIGEEEALDVAQSWLDKNRPGAVVEAHADPFTGYYTIHTLRDDRIEGMLSVHGTTGQVWYHTWHGEFVAMVELEDHD